MTAKQKDILLWVVCAIIGLAQLYLEFQQDGAVKYIGRITFLTVWIYRIHGLGRGLKS